VIASANRRITELGKERSRLDAELEFYKGDLAKAPPKLKRQYEELDQQVAAQKRFIANQEAEKKRVNARYDDELVRLRQLWAQRMTPVAGESAKR
jgi:chromosome segregation ATPase